jgi:arginyl-tRNA--protein-N-Asp/Glu arginylyltransferase
MEYLHWDKKIISDISSEQVHTLYEKGYVFTRIEKGVMHQTRSVRIDLRKFELSSENRRILKKVEHIDMVEASLPYENYTWSLAKMAKDFYDTKFGVGIMSANKIKEILTTPEKSNFNTLLVYGGMGYAICFTSGGATSFIHYSYPFYDLNQASKDMGMGMMLKAILRAKERGLAYIYLGSLQRPGDAYKLQFAGLEWFDGGPDGSGTWQSNIDTIKNILK